MKIPAPGPAPVALQCRHCTVPTEGGDVCQFCATTWRDYADQLTPKQTASLEGMAARFAESASVVPPAVAAAATALQRICSSIHFNCGSPCLQPGGPYSSQGPPPWSSPSQPPPH